jgi:hypothetical protein
MHAQVLHSRCSCVDPPLGSASVVLVVVTRPRMLDGCVFAQDIRQRVLRCVPDTLDDRPLW